MSPLTQGLNYRSACDVLRRVKPADQYTGRHGHASQQRLFT